MSNKQNAMGELISASFSLVGNILVAPIKPVAYAAGIGFMGAWAWTGVLCAAAISPIATCGAVSATLKNEPDAPIDDLSVAALTTVAAGAVVVAASAGNALAHRVLGVPPLHLFGPHPIEDVQNIIATSYGSAVALSAVGGAGMGALRSVQGVRGAFHRTVDAAKHLRNVATRPKMGNGITNDGSHLVA